MQEADQDHSLITCGEAAEILGYNEVYLRLLLRKGFIRAAQLGREWILFRADVLEYKENPPKRGRPREKREYAKQSSYWEMFGTVGIPLEPMRNTEE